MNELNIITVLRNFGKKKLASNQINAKVYRLVRVLGLKFLVANQ